MVDFLQQLDFRSSNYERPDKPWVCGYAANGQACQIGPGKRGQCRASFQCSPVKSGDRWQCNRSQPFGGPCESGPNADGTCCLSIPRCQPVRSWRSRRGVVTRWMVGLTLGLLLIVFSVPGSLSILSPGELSRQHGTLSECTSCHTSADMGFRQWVSSVFTEYDHSKDDERCQTCHDLGDTALMAHSLSSTEMASISARSSNSSWPSPSVQLASTLFDESIKHGKNVRCSSCHEEHRGASRNISDVRENTCVTCHQSQFESFNKGHPEFNNYPNDRRTHLNFDHISHINQHFVEIENQGVAPKACLDCHITRPDGGKMVLQGFEQTCGNCHSSQIIGVGRASAKGLAILGLPGIDVFTLADNGIAIGEWPEYTEERLSPFMLLLLNQTPGFSDTYGALAELDLLDLSDASQDQFSQVKNLIWMIKEFMYDLEVRGAVVMAERMTTLTGKTVEHLQTHGLLGAIPPDLIENARMSWFPSLLKEIPIHLSGEDVLSPLLKSNGAIADDQIGESKSIIDDAFDELFGDDDAASDIGSENYDSEFDELFSEIEEGSESNLNEDIENEFDALFDEGETAGEGKSASNQASNLVENEDEFSIEELESEGDDEFSIDELEGELDQEIEEIDAHVSDELEFEAPRLLAEDRAGAGGWYRDEYQLRYRPTGHADLFLNAWMDISVDQNAPLLSSIFEKLTQVSSPGACAKCHSIDTLVSGETTINWKVRQSEIITHEFNRFSHEAHFNLLSQDGCLTCHSFDSTSDYAGSFDDQNPLSFASNFQSISKQACIECHSPKEAGESCLTCHNYHIGDFNPPTVEQIHMTTKNP